MRADARLDLAPVLPVLDQHARAHPDPMVTAGRVWALSDLITMSRRQATRIVREGAIGINAADRLASRLGMHPANVWGDEWWTTEGEQEVPCPG